MMSLVFILEVKSPIRVTDPCRHYILFLVKSMSSHANKYARQNLDGLINKKVKIQLKLNRRNSALSQNNRNKLQNELRNVTRQLNNALQKTAHRIRATHAQQTIARIFRGGKVRARLTNPYTPEGRAMIMRRFQTNSPVATRRAIGAAIRASLRR